MIDSLSVKDLKKELRSRVYIMIFCLVVIFYGLFYLVTGWSAGTGYSHPFSNGIETRVVGFGELVIGIIFFRISHKQYKSLKNKISESNQK